MKKQSINLLTLSDMASGYYFNYKSISDEDLQNLYGETFKLGRQAVRLFRNGYERNGEKLYVQFRYVRDSNHFNAYALPLGNKYEVGISVPTIYLLRTLFDNLLFDPELLPTIKRGKNIQNKQHYSVQFLQDIEGMEQQYRKTKITADLDRLLVSSLLTDFCSAFIVLHEIGHVVLGHADYRPLSFGKQANSMFHGSGTTSKKETAKQHVLEHDADIIAAKLLSQYIYNFVQDIPGHPTYDRLLKSLQPEEHLFESITALVLQGILSMFLYIGHAEGKINKNQTHPYPVVRIRYIRDVIGMLMEENYGLDIDITNQYMDRYSQQFLKAQFSSGLLPFPKHKMLTKPTLIRHTQALRQHAEEFRPLTRNFTWVPLSDWY